MINKVHTLPWVLFAELLGKLYFWGLILLLNNNHVLNEPKSLINIKAEYFGSWSGAFLVLAILGGYLCVQVTITVHNY